MDPIILMTGALKITRTVLSKIGSKSVFRIFAPRPRQEDEHLGSIR